MNEDKLHDTNPLKFQAAGGFGCCDQFSKYLLNLICKLWSNLKRQGEAKPSHTKKEILSIIGTERGEAEQHQIKNPKHSSGWGGTKQFLGPPGA